ncbi:MAG: DUF1634 domain-containing protein [candidate division Zixibacteria bacterium]|nr:DUF1634 domain-containing protein [candidate division Zixibacteria bacterium]
MQKEDTVYRYISFILKVGMYSSVLVLLSGFLLLISFPVLEGINSFSLSELPYQIVKLNPYALINSGILILIITPVLRVIVAMISFSHEKERRYFWIATGVFFILVGSIIFSAFKI